MRGASSLPVGPWMLPTQTIGCVDSANRTSSIVGSNRTGHQSGTSILVLVATITCARRSASAMAFSFVAGRLVDGSPPSTDGLSPAAFSVGQSSFGDVPIWGLSVAVSAAMNSAFAAPPVASSSARVRKSVDFPPLPMMAVVFRGMCKNSLRMPTPRVSRARYARAEWAARDATRPSRGKLPA